MDVTWLYAALGVLLVLAFKLFTRGPRRNLPPSPPALPVIGHLHLLKQPLHRIMHNLSQKYGPIFSLRLGSRMVLVVSSPAAAEECFTKNDITFANRPPFLIGKYIGYNHSTMVASPYGEHWRNLRRLSALEIFSASRLNSFISIRKDEVRLLVESLYKSSPSGVGRVELRPGLTELTFNNMTRMVAGKRYYGHDSMEDYEEAKKVRWLISEVFKYGGTTYPEDYLPFLKRLGYMKLENKLAEVTEKMDVFFQGLIDEHRRQRGTRNSMIEHLLTLQESQPEYYTDLIIKGLILNMLIAGTDTSAVTVEWAMSFLLNNPESLKKVRAELDAEVGQDRLMEESDISKVPYLQHIISETLRLCPPAPLLVPHMASKDCTVGGYDVPAGTVLLPNAWTIQRDPTVWEDPETFKPERFQGVEYEAHKLLPFGMGRRICPGASLAQRIVGLTLGSLIQCFDWERVNEQPVDLSEGVGITMPKAEPLEAMCKARDIMTKLF